MNNEWPVHELAQAPVSKLGLLWLDGLMEKAKGYIVWFTPANRKFVRTYEEAWRYAEDQYQKTGTVAFVEAVN